MSELTQELSALAGQWIARQTFVAVPVSPSTAQLVTANPLRWALWLGVDTSSVNGLFTLALSADISATGAMNVGNTNQPILLSYRQWGGLVQQAWFGAGNSGPATINVIELLLQQ